MNHTSTTVLLARLGASGGALFALGNLLHPLEHGDAAEASATWEAAHLLFGLGAVLICAGIFAIAGVMSSLRLARVGAVATWLAMLLIPIGSYFEIYVAPELSEATVERIESSAAAFAVVQVLPFLLGPVLLGIAAFRAGTWPVAARFGLIAAPVVTLAAPALPGEDGIWIIAGTALLGAALAVAGLASAALAARTVAPEVASSAGAVSLSRG